MLKFLCKGALRKDYCPVKGMVSIIPVKINKVCAYVLPNVCVCAFSMEGAWLLGRATSGSATSGLKLADSIIFPNFFMPRLYYIF